MTPQLGSYLNQKIDSNKLSKQKLYTQAVAQDYKNKYLNLQDLNDQLTLQTEQQKYQIEKATVENERLLKRIDKLKELLEIQKSLQLDQFGNLQDALTKRNNDYDFAEDNNRQLLSLLEKYDHKLDELQEDNELKELKILEYERRRKALKNGQLVNKQRILSSQNSQSKELNENNSQSESVANDESTIKIESVEEKIKFIIGMLQKLRQMHASNASQDISLSDDDIFKQEKYIKRIALGREDDQEESIDKLTSEILAQIKLIEKSNLKGKEKKDRIKILGDQKGLQVIVDNESEFEVFIQDQEQMKEKQINEDGIIYKQSIRPYDSSKF